MVDVVLREVEKCVALPGLFLASVPKELPDTSETVPSSFG